MSDHTLCGRPDHRLRVRGWSHVEGRVLMKKPRLLQLLARLVLEERGGGWRRGVCLQTLSLSCWNCRSQGSSGPLAVQNHFPFASSTETC